MPLAVALLAQVSSALPANTETWEWDSKAPICTLKQQVPLGAQAVTIERTPGDEETELLVVLPKGTKSNNGHYLDAVISTGAGRTFPADISLWVDEAGRANLYLDSPDPAFIDSLSDTAWLEISYSKNKSIRVPIHIPSKIIATLRECEDTTMSGWGIDPVAWRSLKSRPLPLDHIRQRFSKLNYPADALAANLEADAVTKLDVASDGSVASCKSLDAQLPKSFETASCEIFKGAKFKPATDANGTPTSASIVYDVRFRIDD